MQKSHPGIAATSVAKEAAKDLLRVGLEYETLLAQIQTTSPRLFSPQNKK